MKKIIILLVIAVAAASVTFGQKKKSNDKGKTVEAQIIALEKEGWNAWKNKDISWFQANLTDDALSVNSAGVADKTQFIKDLGSCEVKSFSLDNFRFLMLNKDSALITFTGMQDAVCGGKTMPSSVRATSVYVRRGGKWLNTYYTEIPMTQ